MRRVLIVEDDADGRTLLINMLQRVELEPEGARSAEEATRLLDKYKYDAVVIDLMLPGMDGLALLKIIRSSLHTTRLCCAAVTAFHSESIRKQALEIGFDLYFTKPLDMNTFGNRLKTAIEEVQH